MTGRGSSSELRFTTVRPGPDCWLVGSASLADVVRMLGPPPPPEPLTTTDLAADGQPVGTEQDVLLVVAHLRCRRYRNIIGAVLHLDRSRRGLPPVLLAELCQSEINRWISEETAAGAVSTGARLPPAGLGCRAPTRTPRTACAQEGRRPHTGPERRSR